MVAICTMISKPFHIETWLDYHFSIGIDYIFLRVEKTPELKDILVRYPNVFTLYDSDVDTFNNYWTIQDRQTNFFNTIKSKLMELKVNWVFFNIDADELLCCENVNNLIKNVSNKFDIIQISNYEAVYANDQVQNPFLETNTFKTSSLLAYSNGKCAARLNTETKVNGPHGFKGKLTKLPPNKICVLHYESSNFERWYDKFYSYINSDEESIEKIPFSFYRESIKIIKEGDIEESKNYYNSKKVNIDENVIRLYWTPLLEQKNICWG